MCPFSALFLIDTSRIFVAKFARLLSCLFPDVKLCLFKITEFALILGSVIIGIFNAIQKEEFAEYRV